MDKFCQIQKIHLRLDNPGFFGNFYPEIQCLMAQLLRIFLLSFTLFLFGACKKAVEDQKRDLLVQAMTDGQWRVETFQEGSVSVTDEFTGYVFQFRANGTITGSKNDLPQEDGTWISDIQNLSITSNFPSASEPLKKLNGTWRIRDSQADYVVAEMSSSSGKNILHLRKIS